MSLWESFERRDVVDSRSFSLVRRGEVSNGGSSIIWRHSCEDQESPAGGVVAVACVEERLRRHCSVAAAANGISGDAWRKENESEGKFENAVHGDCVQLKRLGFLKGNAVEFKILVCYRNKRVR